VSADRPSLEQAIVEAIRAQLVQLHVAMPARVESYDAATRKCSATPLIRRGVVTEAGVRTTELMPVIPDIPVVMPGSGGARVKFPVSRGDTVLLVFADGSLDRWLVRGGEVDPGDDRSHTLTDAVAIPGLADFASAGDAATHIEVTDLKIDLGGGATEAAIRGTAYRTAEDILLTALGVFATSIGGAVPGQAGAAATLNTAITTFQAAAATYLATKVKVV
jgi:hypothetical protein